MTRRSLTGFYCFVTNPRGQMSIFVAMIFQVLFVLFAMAINIGLVVHDKINLQNAVDLGAYYGAAKQAEMLNAIAHQNYQIRQAYKLMSWRYRVLGTMGLESPRHPASFPGGGPAVDAVYADGAGNPMRPVTCVTYGPVWRSGPNFPPFTPEDNLCKEPRTDIPEIPRVRVVAPFLNFNLGLDDLALSAQQDMQNRCEYHGAVNWWFSMANMTGYRWQQYHRKMLIWDLAGNMLRPINQNQGSFADLNGESVYQGIQNTVSKNLTFENRSSLQSLEVLNGLRQAQNVTPEQVFPEIRTALTMAYMDTQGGTSCTSADPPPLVSTPPLGKTQWLINNMQAEPMLALSVGEPSDETRMSMGVEKNPWIMAYIGVKATTRPRQLFWPVGEPVTFTARAFAKPFGGRIGPWHGQRWPQAAEISEGDKLEDLFPPRMGFGGTLTSSDNDPSQLPNYPRYPGDPVGLQSVLAQSALANQYSMVLMHTFYQRIWQPYQQGLANDYLPWNDIADSAPAARRWELAAMAPDLFDVTYYSVEPNSAEHYQSKILNNRDRLGLRPNVVVLYDLGSRGTNPDQLSTVELQMQSVQGPPYLHTPKAYYFIREPAHLLTGWVHPSTKTGLFNEFPEDMFGRCLASDSGIEPKVPGSCVSGGRTGYSVKFVSRNQLLGSQYQLGGSGEATGPIRNPPNPDF